MRPFMGLFALLLMCGCTAPTAPASTTPVAAPTTSHPAPANVTEPDFSRIAMQGQTPVGGCLFSAVAQCEFTQGSDYETNLTYQGRPLFLDGNATLTQGTNAVHIQVILFAKVNGTSTIAPGNGTLVDSASPLHFHMDLTHLAGIPLALGVYSSEGAGAPVGYAVANVPQGFTLQATLASQVTRPA
ncbi:MAG: hypothetical protein ACYDBQ_01710 [Thermoplasmatota archaeon]